MPMTAKAPLTAAGVQLPHWAAQMARKYAASALSTFILHGNVLDLVAYEQKGKRSFKPLVDFLTGVFFAQRRLVITYDLSSGIQCPTKEMRGEIMNAVRAIDTIRGTEYAERGLPNRGQAFSYVMELEGRRIAFSGDQPRDFRYLDRVVSEPLDLLVMEMTHIRPEEVLPWLADRPVAKLLLTHIWDPWHGTG